MEGHAEGGSLEVLGEAGAGLPGEGIKSARGGGTVGSQ